MFLENTAVLRRRAEIFLKMRKYFSLNCLGTLEKLFYIFLNSLASNVACNEEYLSKLGPKMSYFPINLHFFNILDFGDLKGQEKIQRMPILAENI